MPFYLIRHPPPLISAGTCYGQSDIEAEPLSPQARAEILRQLPEPVRAPIYSSPLRRCSQTARALFPDGNITFDPRLQELNFGTWELTPWEQIPRQSLDAWAADLANFAPPSGESFRQLLTRCADFITSTAVEQPQIIVTHAGVIRAFEVLRRQVPLAAALSLQIPYNSVHQLP